jgi:AAA domain (dynein-related subfamily)
MNTHGTASMGGETSLPVISPPRFRFDVRPSLQALLRQEELPLSAEERAVLGQYAVASSLSRTQKRTLLTQLVALCLREHSAAQLAPLLRPLLPALCAALADLLHTTTITTTTTPSASATTSVHAPEALLALSHLLPLAPQCLPHALQQMSVCAAPFALPLERMLADDAANAGTNEAADNAAAAARHSPTSSSLRHALDGAHRLLRRWPEHFSALWDWSVLHTLLDRADVPLRMLAQELLGTLAGLSDGQRVRLAASLEVEELAGARLHELDLADAAQQALVFADTCAPHAESHYEQQQRAGDAATDQQGTGDAAAFTVEDLHQEGLVDVCGLLLPRRNAPHRGEAAPSDPESPSPLIYTPTATENLAALALAVSDGCPVLLEGIPGSGKTSLVRELAERTGNTDLVQVHLGDQADGKSLLGNYVSTDRPGEFRWQAGSLTQAVTQGRWLVIEDFDLVPVEVVSVLLPLLERREIFLSSRGETLQAAPGFQLFATASLTATADGSTGRNSQAITLTSNFWTRYVGV